MFSGFSAQHLPHRRSPTGTGVGAPVGSYLCDTAPGEIISFGPAAAIPSTTADAARTQANCAGTPPPTACTAFTPVPATIFLENFTVPAGPNAVNRTLTLHAGDVVTITATTTNGSDVSSSASAPWPGRGQACHLSGRSRAVADGCERRKPARQLVVVSAALATHPGRADARGQGEGG